MAPVVMREGRIDAVVVGADRIASNGDVANKIGTFGVSLAAREFNIPFYVAAPVSTFDMELASGSDIPIEERDPEEITRWGDHQIAPDGIDVYSPAFDVTPAANVDAIITEKGVIKNPTAKKMSELYNR
jgi:methylthioribose-1-phosphate isomerase